ncbi:hypothetical protein TUM17563_24130 [Klebsiella oxytoca]|nr:hypothetical protein TUM17563_24130 [Klebsiella oxytoca]
MIDFPEAMLRIYPGYKTERCLVAQTGATRRLREKASSAAQHRAGIAQLAPGFIDHHRHRI